MNETAPTSALSNVVLGFTCIVMSVGTLGNLLVLVAFRVDSSAFNAFVVVLGLFDMLACVVHMPLDIASLFDPYMFNDMAVCKFTCFMIAFTAIGSAILLVAIATVRYRAVCRPHSSNLSLKAAVVISVVSVVTAIALSWPIVLMFGVTTVNIDNKTWAFCGVQNAFMMSNYPLTFYIVLASLFAIALTALAALYLLTARELWRKRKVFAAKNSTKTQASATNSELKLVNIGSFPSQMSTTDNRLSFKNQNSLPVPSADTWMSKPSSRNVGNDKKTQRTFMMMFLVSLVFFLSYTPHFILAFYFMAFNMPAFPTSATTHWYGVLMRSFYINNVADPFIYGFCSQEFRKNVRMLCKKIGRFCERKS